VSALSTLERPLEQQAPPARPRKSDGGRIATVVLLLIGSVVFIYPFLWMIATALRTPAGVAHAGISLWPVQWQWVGRPALMPYPCHCHPPQTCAACRPKRSYPHSGS